MKRNFNIHLNKLRRSFEDCFFSLGKRITPYQSGLKSEIENHILAIDNEVDSLIHEYNSLITKLNSNPACPSQPYAQIFAYIERKKTRNRKYFIDFMTCLSKVDHFTPLQKELLSASFARLNIDELSEAFYIPKSILKQHIKNDIIPIIAMHYPSVELLRKDHPKFWNRSDPYLYFTQISRNLHDFLCSKPIQ